MILSLICLHFCCFSRLVKVFAYVAKALDANLYLFQVGDWKTRAIFVFLLVQRVLAYQMA